MEATISQQRSVTEQSETLCNKLWQFRLALEGQAEQSIRELEVQAALLLSDLCVFAGLSEEQHARVLGEEGVAYVNEILEERVRLATSGRVGAARQ
jgi:hypothetical protein